jgi:N-acetylneuraminic acid mutarotase
MADYKEQNVSGNQWQRACAIHIQNTYGQTPQITIQEEQLTNINGEMFQKGAGGINITFDPSQVIVLLDPSTGLPTGGETTQGAIHTALWSLYMQEAAKRDALL